MAKYKPFVCETGVSPQIHIDADGHAHAVIVRGAWAGGATQSISVEVIKLEREDAEVPKPTKKTRVR